MRSYIKTENLKKSRDSISVFMKGEKTSVLERQGQSWSVWVFDCFIILIA